MLAGSRRRRQRGQGSALHADHLVISKRASGRLRDLADVEALTDVGSQE
jgi:hypothetical protein